MPPRTRSLPGSQQAAAPKTGAEQLLPRATFLSQIISTFTSESLQSLARNFLKRLEELQVFSGGRRGRKHFQVLGGCEPFRVLRGAASLWGCSSRRGPFLKEEVLGSSQGLGAFVGNMESLQTVESLGFFLLVHLKEPLGELRGSSFSKFTFMKYE